MLNVKEKLVVAMFGYEVKLVFDTNKNNKLNIYKIQLETKDLNLERENSSAGTEDNLKEVVTAQ